jgi:hypothetical protein
MIHNQCPNVVEQNLIGYAANIAKALSRHANQPSWPRCGMPERAVDVSNQGWRQQEYLHLGIGDLNQALAKIEARSTGAGPIPPPALASPPSAVLPTANGDDGEMKN